MDRQGEGLSRFKTEGEVKGESAVKRESQVKTEGNTEGTAKRERNGGVMVSVDLTASELKMRKTSTATPINLTFFRINQLTTMYGYEVPRSAFEMFGPIY